MKHVVTVLIMVVFAGPALGQDAPAKTAISRAVNSLADVYSLNAANLVVYKTVKPAAASVGDRFARAKAAGKLTPKDVQKIGWYMDGIYHNLNIAFERQLDAMGYQVVAADALEKADDALADGNFAAALAQANIAQRNANDALWAGGVASCCQAICTNFIATVEAKLAVKGF